jgi:hypothetical protein
VRADHFAAQLLQLRVVEIHDGFRPERRADDLLERHRRPHGLVLHLPGDDLIAAGAREHADPAAFRLVGHEHGALVPAVLVAGLVRELDRPQTQRPGEVNVIVEPIELQLFEYTGVGPQVGVHEIELSVGLHAQQVGVQGVELALVDAEKVLVVRAAHPDVRRFNPHDTREFGGIHPHPAEVEWIIRQGLADGFFGRQIPLGRRGLRDGQVVVADPVGRPRLRFDLHRTFLF